MKQAPNMTDRSSASGSIDEKLHKLCPSREITGKMYFPVVLQQLPFFVRGLPLRGSNEIIGSGNNGNYLGILEWISQFDPFLSQHICQFANRGRGHSFYLSKTICDEIFT